jgi:nucleoside-diphosphate-sugar epimerase
MTDYGHEPTPPACAPAGRVVVIGAPSSLRSAAARRLHAAGVLLACLDTQARMASPLASAAASGEPGPGGAAVVLVTVPRLPGLASRLRYRFRTRVLAAGFEQAVTTAREHGIARVVVLSTVFSYDDDRGLPLHPGCDALAAAETAPAAAAEQAARMFASLGGDSVVLRLGWTCGPREAITRQVLSAARRGWRLIDGDPTARVAMIAEPDAARAVLPALTLPPGIYNVTDGSPVTQGALNARLETALGRDLHTLDDPQWGYGSTLFGSSRRITDRTFSELTGWRPRHVPAAEYLAGMLPRPPRHQPLRPSRLDTPARLPTLPLF